MICRNKLIVMSHRQLAILLFMFTIAFAVFIGFIIFRFDLASTPMSAMNLERRHFLSEEECDDYQCDVARRLRGLWEELHDTVIDANPLILLEMNNIITQLDHKFGVTSETLLGSDSLEPDTCEEIYIGKEIGFPLYLKGFVQSPSCEREQMKPISELVTVLLLDRDINISHTSHVLQNIYSFNSDLKVIVAVTASNTAIDKMSSRFKNVIVEKCYVEDILVPGNTINSMVKKVKTPYVLIARDLFHLDDLARLERQVFVLSKVKNLGVVGGAFRNESGFWKVGCHLLQIKNYFLKYTEGYKYSSFDCMFCDHLEGPFIAKTSLLRRIQFKKNINDEVVFEDWFLRLNHEHVLTMNCPDVMYFKKGPIEGPLTDLGKYQENSSWLQLAREWLVEQIYFPNRISIKFTCLQLSIYCGSAYFNTLLIPTCCLEQFSHALQIFHTFTVEKELDYEIESHLILGAVKFENIQPWDLKGQVAFLLKDRDIYREHMKYFRKRHIHIYKFNKKSFSIFTPDIEIEAFGKNLNNTNEPLLREWKKTTQVKVNGIWIRGKWNPGLYIKNIYGTDYLKHTNVSSVQVSRDIFSQRKKQCSWKICTENGNHASLRRYSMDGSIDLFPVSLNIRLKV